MTSGRSRGSARVDGDRPRRSRRASAPLHPCRPSRITAGGARADPAARRARGQARHPARPQGLPDRGVGMEHRAVVLARNARPEPAPGQARQHPHPPRPGEAQHDRADRYHPVPSAAALSSMPCPTSMTSLGTTRPPRQRRAEAENARRDTGETVPSIGHDLPLDATEPAPFPPRPCDEEEGDVTERSPRGRRDRAIPCRDHGAASRRLRIAPQGMRRGRDHEHGWIGDATHRACGVRSSAAATRRCLRGGEATPGG